MSSYDLRRRSTLISLADLERKIAPIILKKKKENEKMKNKMTGIKFYHGYLCSLEWFW